MTNTYKRITANTNVAGYSRVVINEAYFTASGSVITTTDADNWIAVFNVGDDIYISGTVSNNGWFSVATVTATTITTNESITGEGSSGSTVTTNFNYAQPITMTSIIVVYTGLAPGATATVDWYDDVTNTAANQSGSIYLQASTYDLEIDCYMKRGLYIHSASWTDLEAYVYYH
jgi:hypothetical protein